MSNQIECVPFPGKSFFRSNGAGSHIFGLEPHFGCCTSNFNQGWPKLCQSVLMKSDAGIVNTTPIPVKLNTEINGKKVFVEINTLYPFRDRVEYTVKADEAVDFELKIRVPSWAKSVKLDGEAVEVKDYLTVSKSWQGEQTVVVEFTRDIEMKTLGGGLYFVNYGPLVFSLPIKGRWEMKEYTRNDIERKFPYCDWHVYRESEFAYGFDNDSFTVVPKEGCDIPFSHDNPMLTVEANMRRINWEMADGYLNVPAKYPTDRRPVGKSEKITLVPYGCTALRMTEMPFCSSDDTSDK